MPDRTHGRRTSQGLGGSAAVGGALLLLAGCASPGPPRAPSLQLPAVVDRLTAVRQADTVSLHFALPTTTSDGVPYRGASVRADVCRAVDAGPCQPLPALAGVPFATRRGGSQAADAQAEMHDELPPALTRGPARLLTYRMELRNEQGHSAGYGGAAYSAAGAAPGVVAGLQVRGARAGVVVRWAPGTAGDVGEVVLRRELVHSGSAANAAAPAGIAAKPTSASRAHAGAHPQAGVVWLSTTPAADPLTGEAPAPAAGAHAGSGVVDDGAEVGSTYRYAAERQRSVQLGGHSVVLQSPLCAPVEITLVAEYPPAAPTDLAGTAFPGPPDASGAPGPTGVDLIWTPPDEPALAGYNVYREPVDAEGKVAGARVRLTSAPVNAPYWHDVPPAGVAGFRYSVTAVDARGLESPAVSTVVQTK